MKREKITSIIYKNSTDNSEGLMIKFENIANVINLLCEADMPVEETKQDYEILSFKSASGHILKLNKGYYSTNSGGNYDLQFLLRGVKTNHYTIHSVRRLSDGEVFTMGDKFRHGEHDGIFEVVRIEIRQNMIQIWDDSSLINLNWAVKVKHPLPVLLTTEDGVEVTNPQQELYVCFMNFSNSLIQAKLVSSNKNNKYFSTKEAMGEYILQNKPVTTTYSELEKVLDGKVEYCNLEKLMAFFKSKQS